MVFPSDSTGSIGEGAFGTAVDMVAKLVDLGVSPDTALGFVSDLVKVGSNRVRKGLVSSEYRKEAASYRKCQQMPFLPGYCYLHVIKVTRRFEFAKLLGPSPAFESVLAALTDETYDARSASLWLVSIEAKCDSGWRCHLVDEAGESSLGTFADVAVSSADFYGLGNVPLFGDVVDPVKVMPRHAKLGASLTDVFSFDAPCVTHDSGDVCARCYARNLASLFDRPEHVAVVVVPKMEILGKKLLYFEADDFGVYVVFDRGGLPVGWMYSSGDAATIPDTCSKAGLFLFECSLGVKEMDYERCVRFGRLMLQQDAFVIASASIVAFLVPIAGRVKRVLQLEGFDGDVAVRIDHHCVEAEEVVLRDV